MWLPINKILLPGFFCLIGYEVYNLFLFCTPPRVDLGSANAVVWDLSSVEKLDLGVVLSLSDAMPNTTFRAAHKKQVFVGEFAGVEPASISQAASLPDLEVRNLSLPRGFYNNGTVYIHVLAVLSSNSSQVLRHTAVKISRHVLQAGRKEPTRYLLSEKVSEGMGAAKPVSSLPRIIEVGFVQETEPLNGAALMEKGLSSYVRGSSLKLPLFINTLVSPRDEYVPLLQPAKADNPELIEPLGFDVRFRSIGVGYWTLQHQITMAFDDAEKMMQLNEYDVDSFKQMIGGSSPFKIVAVYGIAVLHLVFGYLAFTNDLSFWRSKTSFEGFSSNSIALQAVTNIISFLYVREQKQTKFVMYFIAIRFCLQLWKLRKLTALERSAKFPFFCWVNRVGADSKLEELQDIADHERRCMRYLAIVLIPVVIAFCLYRLVFYRFRSWYSWAVLSLAVCSQAGGFVVMTPQVFMNHRLKSVEHLPWRALTYQAINTFIDDVFALCVRMPEIQKYSAFRDDIVFIICCGQRWLYRKKVSNGDSVQDEKSKEE